MKNNTTLQSFAFSIATVLCLCAQGISGAAALPVSSSDTKALSKVCVNTATGNVAVRTKCMMARQPAVELEAPSGATNIGVRAYGFVLGDGTLDKTRSSANVSSRRIREDIYCVRAVGLDPKTGAIPVVSVEFSFSICQGSPVLPMSRNINSGCKDDEYAFVVWGCNYKPEPDTKDDGGNAFSFIIP